MPWAVTLGPTRVVGTVLAAAGPVAFVLLNTAIVSAGMAVPTATVVATESVGAAIAAFAPIPSANVSAVETFSATVAASVAEPAAAVVAGAAFPASVTGSMAQPAAFVQALDYSGIANCALWMQGDLGVTGSPVSAWADQSGNAHNATATSTRRPSTSASIHARTCVSFDGVNNCLTLPTFASSGAKTIVLVRKLTTVPGSGGWYTLLSLKDPGNTFSDVNSINTGGYKSETVLAEAAGAAPSVGINPTLDTAPHSLIVTYSGGGNSTPSNYGETLDGVAQTVAASGLLGRALTDLAAIGARTDGVNVAFPAACDFALILVYTRVLTASEIAAIAASTVATWGV